MNGSTVRQTKSGVQFPPIYRTYFPDSNGTKVYNYSFTPPNPGGMPLMALDPDVDGGCVFIGRYPKSVGGAFIDGFKDALTNQYIGREDVQRWFETTQSEDGYFTLQHRPPPPGGPDHLLIYQAVDHDRNAEWLVVTPDGTTSDDPDDFYGDDGEV